MTDLVPLRRNASFQLLWVGSATSQLDSQLTRLAMPLLILALTGSAGWVGIVVGVRVTATVLLQIPAGVWVQEESRQHAAGLAGPPLGALLHQLGRAVPFVADAATFLVALLCTIAAKVPDGRPEAQRPGRPACARRPVRASGGCGTSRACGRSSPRRWSSTCWVGRSCSR